ncbi:hypothetical protein [Occallatibacter savannae]|uniref:hypothetical protein n=1 Tax=Occallatibacter savannae TaxID=1002691 RepID=UPI0013A564D0|nr:hypothetical protein [Occallatibacter savannae]
MEVLRQFKMNELKARILLYELEHSALVRELRTAGVSNQRRAEIHRRLPRLKLERTEAKNDFAWLNAEERLQRPERLFQVSAMVI